MNIIAKKENSNHPVLSFKNRFNELFDDLFSNSIHSLPSIISKVDFEPRVNVSETDDAYQIDAELAGVSKDDINLNYQNGIVTIRAERKEKKEEKKKNYSKMESFYGSFQRSLQLPNNADEKHISAKFADGVLKVAIPKSAKSEITTSKIVIN